MEPALIGIPAKLIWISFVCVQVIYAYPFITENVLSETTPTRAELPQNPKLRSLVQSYTANPEDQRSTDTSRAEFLNSDVIVDSNIIPTNEEQSVYGDYSYGPPRPPSRPPHRPPYRPPHEPGTPVRPIPIPPNYPVVVPADVELVPPVGTNTRPVAILQTINEPIILALRPLARGNTRTAGAKASESASEYTTDKVDQYALKKGEDRVCACALKRASLSNFNKIELIAEIDRSNASVANSTQPPFTFKEEATTALNLFLSDFSSWVLYHRGENIGRCYCYEKYHPLITNSPVNNNSRAAQEDSVTIWLDEGSMITYVRDVLNGTDADSNTDLSSTDNEDEKLEENQIDDSDNEVSSSMEPAHSVSGHNHQMNVSNNNDSISVIPADSTSKPNGQIGNTNGTDANLNIDVSSTNKEDAKLEENQVDSSDNEVSSSMEPAHSVSEHNHQMNVPNNNDFISVIPADSTSKPNNQIGNTNGTDANLNTDVSSTNKEEVKLKENQINNSDNEVSSSVEPAHLVSEYNHQMNISNNNDLISAIPADSTSKPNYQMGDDKGLISVTPVDFTSEPNNQESNSSGRGLSSVIPAHFASESKGEVIGNPSMISETPSTITLLDNVNGMNSMTAASTGKLKDLVMETVIGASAIPSVTQSGDGNEESNSAVAHPLPDPVPVDAIGYPPSISDADIRPFHDGDIAVKSYTRTIENIGETEFTTASSNSKVKTSDPSTESVNSVTDEEKIRKPIMERVVVSNPTMDFLISSSPTPGISMSRLTTQSVFSETKPVEEHALPSEASPQTPSAIDERKNIDIDSADTAGSATWNIVAHEDLTSKRTDLTEDGRGDLKTENEDQLDMTVDSCNNASDSNDVKQPSFVPVTTVPVPVDESRVEPIDDVSVTIQKPESTPLGRSVEDDEPVNSAARWYVEKIAVHNVKPEPVPAQLPEFMARRGFEDAVYDEMQRSQWLDRRIPPVQAIVPVPVAVPVPVYDYEMNYGAQQAAELNAAPAYHRATQLSTYDSLDDAVDAFQLSQFTDPRLL